jgi:uncharacterized protein YbjT (DUF2867 family)
MRVLVTGGTGVLGREVTRRLRDRGAEVRVLTRRPDAGQARGDLETGAGLAEAVAGVDAIVHCASAGDWRRPQRDVAQTRNLIEAVTGSGGRPHLVYVSIVGVDRMRFGLYRAKFACEKLIASSGLPWTVLRATQFHDLILMLAMVLARSPLVLAPRGMRSQPVEVGEAADRLVELALGGPAGRVADLGGPRVEAIDEMIRAYLAATGRRRPVLRVPLFGAAAADFRAGLHLLGPDGVRGQRAFADYLRERVAPNGTVAAPYVLRR